VDDDRLRGALCGLLAALLFGLGAPLGKTLIAHAGPVALASVFYLAAGSVLSLLGGRSDRAEAPVSRTDVPILAGVAILGGIVGPVLMLHGLARVSGVTGALLLNLEAAFTILLAVTVFGEHLGRREIVASGIVVASAVLLGVGADGGAAAATSPRGVLSIVGATLAWGLDNNLMQRLSLRDPIAIARMKALAAGIGSLLIAFAIGDPWPTGPVLLGAVAIGVLSYGVSIVLDTYALRLIGAAREAAYFATAPFFGALLAIPLFGERPSTAQLSAAGLMALGIALLLRERHAHWHVHDAMTHEHVHVHDEHHRHDHASGTGSTEAHSHRHTHEPIGHDHPHVSDAHHRHVTDTGPILVWTARGRAVQTTARHRS
jgi:drug/metabolite transporter (DMT)-like permease